MSSLILRREGRVALLVLRRPPININALDRQTLEELGEAVGEVRADSGARVLVTAGVRSRWERM